MSVSSPSDSCKGLEDEEGYVFRDTLTSDSVLKRDIITVWRDDARRVGSGKEF